MKQSFGFKNIFTHMGAFGAKTTKPSVLWSSESWIQHLVKSVPSNSKADQDVQVVRTVACVGRTSISGGRHLKETQAYPDDYGHVICFVFCLGGHVFSSQEPHKTIVGLRG